MNFLETSAKAETTLSMLCVLVLKSGNARTASSSRDSEHDSWDRGLEVVFQRLEVGRLRGHWALQCLPMK